MSLGADNPVYQLRFLGQFQADFQLKSGWIEPLLVGGHAPFSPRNSLKNRVDAILVVYKASDFNKYLRKEIGGMWI